MTEKERDIRNKTASEMMNGNKWKCKEKFDNNAISTKTKKEMKKSTTGRMEEVTGRIIRGKYTFDTIELF
jgi:hypothetical protein